MIVIAGFSELETSLFLKVASDLSVEESVRIVVAEHADEPQAFFAEMDVFSPKLPKVVIMNLDNFGWRDLLHALKHDEIWHYIPVMAFGFLESLDDIKEFYARGGTSCIRKPHGYEGLVTITRTAMQYWIDVSFLPNQFIDRCA